jgi:selenocysteine-specific elongation factor
MEPSSTIDCNLYYLKSADRTLVNRQRVRLYYGTEEVLCRVVILDKEEIKPGENAYVQLRLEKPITAQRNDRYVIRNYSPMYTIAGGSIIEPVAKKAKRFDKKYLEQLKLKESGRTESILENAVYNLSNQYPDMIAIIKGLGKNLENIDEKLEALIKEGLVIKLISSESNIYIHKDFLKDKIIEIERLLVEYHKENPLKFGMSKEEIKNKIFGKSLKQKNYDEILQLLEERKIIKVSSKFISIYDFHIKYNKEQERIRKYIISEYEKSKYNCPKYNDLANEEKDKNTFKMVYESLLDQEILVKLSEECILTKDNYENAKIMIKEYIEKNGAINASTSRELLETNRKYAVAILEHLDSIKFTKRVENDRVLY